MEEGLEESEQNTSEFNMSVSYLNRLNQWFYLAGESSLRLDSFNWFHAQMLIFRELSTEMKPDIITSKRNEISELNNAVVENQKFCSNSRRITIPQELWFKLFDFELFLRKVCKDSGLQIKMKEMVDIRGL